MAEQLDPALLAAIQEAVAAGMAAQAPLEAPPPTAALTMTTTPKLGLKQPALDDPALITDLNDNFGILDGCITATQAVTLTNKTLDAPIINNPTVNGWTNAQHTHLGAAGGGGLDGAAIVSGYTGTGNLLRETAAAFTDPLVRDTLSFGAKPSGAADAWLQRMTSGRLKLTGGVANSTTFYEAQQGASGARSTTMARFGQPAADGVWLTWNAHFTADGTWHADDVTKPARVYTHALGNFAWYDAVGAEPLVLRQRMLLDGNGTLSVTPIGVFHGVFARNYSVGWGPGDSKWSTNYASLDFPNASVYVLTTAANTLELGMNTYVSQDGSRRARAGSIPGSILQLTTSSLQFFQMAQVATDAVQSPVNRLNTDATSGTFTMSPASGQPALVMNGHFQTNASASSYAAIFANGGFVQWNDATNNYGARLGGSTANFAEFSALAQPGGVRPTVAWHNAAMLGSTNQAWSAVYAANGTIQPSSLEAKENIAPLDPAACAAAVLDTDWVSFRYHDPPWIEPEPPAPPPGGGDRALPGAARRAEARARYDEHLRETAHIRHQNGYILGSPEHRVHDLFGLADRKSKHDGADLAVVACALQQALRDLAAARAEITALEDEVEKLDTNWRRPS